MLPVQQSLNQAFSNQPGVLHILHLTHKERPNQISTHIIPSLNAHGTDKPFDICSGVSPSLALWTNAKSLWCLCSHWLFQSYPRHPCVSHEKERKPETFLLPKGEGWRSVQNTPNRSHSSEQYLWILVYCFLKTREDRQVHSFQNLLKWGEKTMHLICTQSIILLANVGLSHSDLPLKKLWEITVRRLCKKCFTLWKVSVLLIETKGLKCFAWQIKNSF